MNEEQSSGLAVVHTDGACIGNPGPGGWSAVIRWTDGAGNTTLREITGGAERTTNNRMEMTAAIEALTVARSGTVQIVTDSQILVRGMTEWLPGWVAKGWRNSSRKPVENRDLWERLVELSRGRNVSWLWVRGHNGNPDNERADALANAAARAFA
jgi:ribonuclease HI